MIRWAGRSEAQKEGGRGARPDGPVTTTATARRTARPQPCGVYTCCAVSRAWAWSSRSCCSSADCSFCKRSFWDIIACR